MLPVLSQRADTILAKALIASTVEGTYRVIQISSNVLAHIV